MQLKHSETSFKKIKFPITVVCDKIRTPENIGMTFRVCESFGVQKIILSAESPSPKDKTVKRISRNTNELIAYETSNNLFKTVTELKQNGCKIIAVEITKTAIPIQKLNFQKKEELVLIIGTERNGIEEELLHLAHETVYIPMYGENSSMNVVNALSVVLYELTNKMQ